jgi:hypothetical protein
MKKDESNNEEETKALSIENQLRDIERHYQSMLSQTEFFRKDTDLSNYKAVSRTKSFLAHFLWNIEMLRCRLHHPGFIWKLTTCEPVVKMLHIALNSAIDTLQNKMEDLYAQYDLIRRPKSATPFGETDTDSRDENSSFLDDNYGYMAEVESETDSKTDSFVSYNSDEECCYCDFCVNEMDATKKSIGDTGHSHDSRYGFNKPDCCDQTLETPEHIPKHLVAAQQKHHDQKVQLSKCSELPTLTRKRFIEHNKIWSEKRYRPTYIDQKRAI